MCLWLPSCLTTYIACLWLPGCLTTYIALDCALNAAQATSIGFHLFLPLHLDVFEQPGPCPLRRRCMAKEPDLPLAAAANAPNNNSGATRPAPLHVRTATSQSQ